MHRSKLKNICNKKRTDDNYANYKKQRNLCVKVLRKTKKDYLQNLNMGFIRKQKILKNNQVVFQ